MQFRKIEYSLILGGWLMIFTLPALYLYYESLGDESSFDVRELWITWSQLLPLFVIFLLHHLFLLPLYQQRRFTVYACSVAVLLIGFALYQIYVLSSHRREMFPPAQTAPPPPVEDDWMVMDDGYEPGPDPRELLMGPPPKMHHIRTVVNAAIALLMLGFDLGLYVQVLNHRARRRLLALEKEKLEMELGYLKYQINPHFFMNTLNNIHALIDIDNELAKRTIVDLSHLMRYALYDSAVERVPLSKEVDFIRLYISLMRLRYTESVRLEFEVQPTLHDAMVPPLLLICFVENAFKHGVSNRQQSYVDIRLGETPEGHGLLFECRNSRLQHAGQDEHHGIGIANARKRLDLLYGTNYTLTIDDQDPNTYSVCLKLPLT